ncbi:hypothetical protein GQ600_13244 [Phytophthora cactorum]|nr:hypothetical protein GQ600_13244 [Phytophthora cactorum]
MQQWCQQAELTSCISNTRETNSDGAASGGVRPRVLEEDVGLRCDSKTVIVGRSEDARNADLRLGMSGTELSIVRAGVLLCAVCSKLRSEAVERLAGEEVEVVSRTTRIGWIIDYFVFELRVIVTEIVSVNNEATSFGDLFSSSLRNACTKKQTSHVKSLYLSKGGINRDDMGRKNLRGIGHTMEIRQDFSSLTPSNRRWRRCIAPLLLTIVVTLLAMARSTQASVAPNVMNSIARTL